MDHTCVKKVVRVLTTGQNGLKQAGAEFQAKAILRFPGQRCPPFHWSPMPDVNARMVILQAHLPWHHARLFTLSAPIVALLRLRTVSLAALACTLQPANRSGSPGRRRGCPVLANPVFSGKAHCLWPR